VFTTGIDHGRETSGRLCARHATEAGYGELARRASEAPPAVAAPGPGQPAAVGVVNNLRGTANFLRRHGRMPSSVAELTEGMNLREPFPTAAIADPELRRFLDEADAVLRFYEAQGRLPRGPEGMGTPT
jgi:hypothetical protein